MMSRANANGNIFETDVDRQDFVKTLAETCEKTEFEVHAYCLMRNHFHLVIETPQGNLVGGMRWLLSAERWGGVESDSAGLAPGAAGVQSESAGAPGGEAGGASLRGAEARKHAGPGGANHRRGITAQTLGGRGPEAACQERPRETGRGGAIAAGDNRDAAADSGATAHGELEES